MQRRLTAAFAFVLLCIIFLLIRIAVVNASKGNKYAKQVLSQQTYSSRTIPARRGEIVDANGIVMARSERRYNVVLDCYAINQDEDYIEPTIRAVSKEFGVDEDTVRKIVTSDATKDSRYQVLVQKVTKDQKDTFEAYKAGKDLEETEKSSGKSDKVLQAEKDERADIQGVWFEEVYQRTYPFGTLAANVVGFSNDVGDGVTGIENYYNQTLTGTDGRQFGYLDSSSGVEQSTVEPDNGKTVQITLDMNIQQAVQDQIDAFDEEYGTEDSDGKGAKNVGVIVMDPNSGSILAMASNHEYDLSDPYGDYTQEEIKKMGNDAYVEALNKSWENFCVSQSYEPGSVVKPITVASALEEGVVHDGDHFYCGGSLFITDTKINCDNIYGHGDETLEYAIVNSCNVALMEVGAKLGVKNFIRYEKAFGFGSQTGIDLPNENAGVIYNENTIQCLSVYQQLNQFFSIDVTSDTYDSLIDDFADGRSVFTIASTDAPGRIQKKIDTGESELNYLVVPIPDLTDSLTSRTLSITDCLIVNGYSEHESEANDFARWLLFSGMDSFYDRTGLAVCRLDYSYGDSHMDGFTGAYESSIPITKLRTASNFWMELENTFANVWDGTDPNDALYELYSTTMQQMSGTKDYHLQDRITPEAVSISAQLSSGEEEIESTESATTEE